MQQVMQAAAQDMYQAGLQVRAVKASDAVGPVVAVSVPFLVRACSSEGGAVAALVNPLQGESMTV